MNEAIAVTTIHLAHISTSLVGYTVVTPHRDQVLPFAPSAQAERRCKAVVSIVSSRGAVQAGGWKASFEWGDDHAAQTSAVDSGLEVPPRGKAIRVIFSELNRIASHLVATATFGLELGATTVLEGGVQRSGDRIRMNAISSPRAYMRSLATRESDASLSGYVQEAIDICKTAGFDLIILETAGTGQGDTSVTGYCHASLYVMTPEYGAASQLEKINMLDYADVVAVSPSSVYRVLKAAGVLDQHNLKPSKKGSGFVQPLRGHEHWHVDVAYVNLSGTFYYLCSILDGYSRYIVHWEIRETMTEGDVETIVQRARERFPGERPRIITDNGPQFIAKDFKEFIRVCGMTHVRTSPYYPQSNGKIERFHRTIKGDCLRTESPLSVEEAQRVVSGYVAHYNEVRLHNAIGYISPQDKLAGREQEIFAERDRKLEAAREQRKVRRAEASLALGAANWQRVPWRGASACAAGSRFASIRRCTSPSGIDATNSSSTWSTRS